MISLTFFHESYLFKGIPFYVHTSIKTHISFWLCQSLVDSSVSCTFGQLSRDYYTRLIRFLATTVKSDHQPNQWLINKSYGLDRLNKIQI